MAKTDPELLKKYTALLLERDALKKDAESFRISYLQQFGELTVRLFQKKLDCIAKKKSISYWQQAMNRGEPVHASELNRWLENVMADYREELNTLLVNFGRAQRAETSTAYEASRAKTIYRRIAKLIHPDISPAWQVEGIPSLWKRAMEAYRQNDVEELQSVELLVHVLLDENGFDPGEAELENPEERIAAVTAEIHTILTTAPYLYGELLADPDAVEEKKKALEAEYEAYLAHEKELTAILAGLMRNGVTVEWEPN